MTADVEISDKLSAGGKEQSAVSEERSGDVHTPSLKDSTNYFNGRCSMEKRARIEHPEALVKRSSGHHHSRQKERAKVPLTMTADLEISGEKLAGGEEESAVGEEQYADVDMPSLADSTKNSSGRHCVGKMARIEHPEVLVISFKVPFSLECKGCESVIAKGVRINAEKKLVGNYHGKKIWSFTFECVYCGRKIVMERVSNECKYEIIRGAREKSVRHQGKEEPVHRRYLSVSEPEQHRKYMGWGFFPSTDLENQYPFYPLYALVNVKSQR